MVKYFISISLLLLFNTLEARLLKLSDAEEKALSQSFASQIEEETFQHSLWERKNAISNYLPRIDYSLSYTHISEDLLPPEMPAGIGFINPNPVYEDTYKHEITLTQPLTNGGVELVVIRIANLTKELAELQKDIKKQEIIYQIRKSYFDAITSFESVKVAQKSLEWAERNLKKAKLRFQARTVSSTDVLQWESEVINKQSELLNFKSIAEVAMLSLIEKMGENLDEDTQGISLSSLSKFENWFNQGKIEFNPSLAKSPSIRALKLSTKIADEMKNMAFTRFLPQVNAFYNYSWPAWDKVKPQDDGKGWSAGASFKLPLFAGFRNYTHFQQEKSKLKKAKLQEQNSLNQFKINVKRISLFYKSSYQSVTAALKQIDLMKKQFKVMQERYDSRLINQSQLLEVALNVKRVQINYIQKLFECLLLESEFKMAMGLLEVRK